MQVENVELPTLTESLLTKHNIDMEKFMTQQHKERRSTIKNNKKKDSRAKIDKEEKKAKKAEKAKSRGGKRCASRNREGEQCKVRRAFLPHKLYTVQLQCLESKRETKKIFELSKKNSKNLWEYPFFTVFVTHKSTEITVFFY